jgi:UDP-N-acetylglucosamine 4,6-dehydratase/5-epimerase
LKILITGGTGSLGSALTRHWYEQHELTILSRDPHRQSAMTVLYPDIHYILADICNGGEVYRACLGQDILIHAAAAKDVQTGEYHPSEFIRVNVTGSQVVAQEWYKTHPDSGKALLISTDKSCMPINCYGRSKGLAESVFRKYDYSAVRYGNVIESNGSFVHKWRQALAAGNPIKVREPEPTRFCLSMAGAIALIEDALRLMETGGNGIFVPYGLRSFSIRDVAQATGATLEYEPLLPYEKVHEALVAEGEAVVRESDLLCRIIPGWTSDHIQFRSNVAPKMSGEEVLEVMGWTR